MKRPAKLGADPSTGRELFVLSLEGPQDLPAELGLPSPNFYCFMAWDSQDADVDAISRFVEALMLAGGAHFCAWGPGCGRVHDIIDEIDAYPFEPYDEVGSPEGSAIMTTWHEDEPLGRRWTSFSVTRSWMNSMRLPARARLQSRRALRNGMRESCLFSGIRRVNNLDQPNSKDRGLAVVLASQRVSGRRQHHQVMGDTPPPL